MEAITNEAQWIDKLTSISQEFQLEAMNRQHAAELAIESSGTEDNDSDSDYNDSDDDNPENRNDDKNEEPQLNFYDNRYLSYVANCKFELLLVCNAIMMWRKT
ncbi:hypothetical protein HCN44_006990 [Aphidius gifuensis]|uniref:Uncharacterized protein n=1 Tax=Aphidius gifuensis TaxID=684658 RepID=A0A835CW10_APHGI|nr:hypothetical protein HCN44_006990 [Aphidius gifuensis]